MYIYTHIHTRLLNYPSGRFQSPGPQGRQETEHRIICGVPSRVGGAEHRIICSVPSRVGGGGTLHNMQCSVPGRRGQSRGHWDMGDMRSHGASGRDGSSQASGLTPSALDALNSCAASLPWRTTCWPAATLSCSASPKRCSTTRTGTWMPWPMRCASGFTYWISACSRAAHHPAILKCTFPVPCSVQAMPALSPVWGKCHLG